MVLLIFVYGIIHIINVSIMIYSLGEKRSLYLREILGESVGVFIEFM